MDRRTAGLKLRDWLRRHQEAEAGALAALPDSASYDETLSAIEAASEMQVDGLRLTVVRRRRIQWCPVPGCRYGRLRAACAFSNTWFDLSDPISGISLSDCGILWHLLAEHLPEEVSPPGEPTLRSLAAAARNTSQDG